MIAYIPMHLDDPGTRRAILEAWERRPPEIIVYWGEDQSPVFGYAGFGQDYGLELGHWISERYEVARESLLGRTALLFPRKAAETNAVGRAVRFSRTRRFQGFSLPGGEKSSW